MGRHPSRIRTGVSLVLLTELILTQLAVSSPPLHHWLHGVDPVEHSANDHCETHKDAEDAQEAEHVCAITLVASGISSEEGTLDIHPAKELNEPLPPTLPRLVEKPAMARHLARGPPHRF